MTGETIVSQAKSNRKKNESTNCFLLNSAWQWRIVFRYCFIGPTTVEVVCKVWRVYAAYLRIRLLESRGWFLRSV